MRSLIFLTAVLAAAGCDETITKPGGNESASKSSPQLPRAPTSVTKGQGQAIPCGCFPGTVPPVLTATFGPVTANDNGMVPAEVDTLGGVFYDLVGSYDPTDSMKRSVWAYKGTAPYRGKQYPITISLECDGVQWSLHTRLWDVIVSDQGPVGGFDGSKYKHSYPVQIRHDGRIFRSVVRID